MLMCSNISLEYLIIHYSINISFVHSCNILYQQINVKFINFYFFSHSLIHRCTKTIVHIIHIHYYAYIFTQKKKKEKKNSPYVHQYIHSDINACKIQHFSHFNASCLVSLRRTSHHTSLPLSSSLITPLFIAHHIIIHLSLHHTLSLCHYLFLHHESYRHHSSSSSLSLSSTPPPHPVWRVPVLLLRPSPPHHGGAPPHGRADSAKGRGGR